jgi:FKBP-type peptidyl-prolyl cis-trans isomerase 2
MCPVALTDTVSISYTVTLESGEVVEKVPASKPIHLSIGSGRVLKAVEASLLGMNPGETRTIRILPEDAYGTHHANLVHDIKRSLFSGRIDPKPGMILSLTLKKDGRDEQVPATVIAVNSETVTVDYNHPLAGKILIYDVTLHAIGS